MELYFNLYLLSCVFIFENGKYCKGLNLIFCKFIGAT